AQTGAPVGRTLHQDGAVARLTFSPDGRRLLTASETVAQLWDVRTKTEIGAPMRPSGSITNVAFSPDGSTIAIAAGRVSLWNGNTGAVLAQPQMGDSVFDVAFSPDGSRLFAAGEDTSRLWDLRSRSAIGPEMRPSVDVVRDAGTVFAPFAIFRG